MKALSITTILLAAFSFLSAVGYIVAGYYASHEQGAHSVDLASGYMQIVVAAFLAYCGYNAMKFGPASKPLLGISWAIFIGFTVYVIASA